MLAAHRLTERIVPVEKGFARGMGPVDEVQTGGKKLALGRDRRTSPTEKPKCHGYTMA